MKINKLTMPLVLMAAMMLGACDTDSLITTIAEGDGEVQLFCSASTDVVESQTRTTEAGSRGQLPAGLIPSIDEFSMTLTGEHTDKFETKAENLPEGATIEKLADDAWKVEYESSWEKISEIKSNDKYLLNKLKTGKFDPSTGKYLNSYFVSVNYGETVGEGEAKKFVEGRNKPCFAGTSVNSNGDEAPFSIKPKETIPVNVAAKLSNSCFMVSFTEWMLAYFTDMEFKLRTADNVFTFTQVVGDNGSTFNFKHEKRVVTTSTDDEGQTTETITYEQVEVLEGLAMNEDGLLMFDASQALHIFVNPGQLLYFSGSAKKSQPGTAVTFAEVGIGGSLTAQKRYNIIVDCDSAGAGKVQIGFDDTFTDVPAQSIELNPDGN